MKFEIERLHIIYKNLIRMGKPLDAEKFRAELEKRGFKKSERIIDTPQGPLKEYLLREPTGLKDLIVVSERGFVVDAWSVDMAMELASLAYGIYESILGDTITYTMADIIGLYDVTVILEKDAFEIIEKLINSTFVESLRKNLAREDVHGFSVGFSLGVPRAPHEWIVVNMIPIPDPIIGRGGKRLKLMIEYRGVDADKGLDFLKSLEDFVKKIISSASV